MGMVYRLLDSLHPSILETPTLLPVSRISKADCHMGVSCGSLDSLHPITLDPTQKSLDHTSLTKIYYPFLINKKLIVAWAWFGVY